MMGDMGEGWEAFKEQSKQKRAKNREWSTQYLVDNDIEFESKNNGAHLIVYAWITQERKEAVADFWPGTGKYRMRCNKHYSRGVKSLVSEVQDYMS